MSNSDHLALPFIDAAQSQKHVTHNAALNLLDCVVQLSISARNGPPGPIRCVWPRIWSRVDGRIRAASGARSAIRWRSAASKRSSGCRDPAGTRPKIGPDPWTRSPFHPLRSGGN